MKRMPKVIDLFSGCGGLSRGFMDAGYSVIMGVDNDKASLETFKLNHGKNSKAVLLDLFEKNSIPQIKNLLGSQTVDVVIGGPPCQGFSLTGTRNFDDKRNRLYLAMIEAVDVLKPKAFLIENVPGLARLYNGTVKDEILKRFDDLGYNVSMKILCAADYGVPQMRKRVFFIGLKKELSSFFEFPEPTNTPKNYVTCEDAISDLPSRENELGGDVDAYTCEPKTVYQKTMRKNQTALYNHVATNHSEMVKTVIALVPEGGNHKNLPKGVGESRKFNEAWTRYHSNKPSKTIDTGHRNHFHYKWNRVPTIRENARLQSFPDEFKFVGTKTEQNRQVGNAVPPLLGFNVAKKLLEYL